MIGKKKIGKKKGNIITLFKLENAFELLFLDFICR
jgi:hypothetical protein